MQDRGGDFEFGGEFGNLGTGTVGNAFWSGRCRRTGCPGWRQELRSDGAPGRLLRGGTLGAAGSHPVHTHNRLPIDGRHLHVTACMSARRRFVVCVACHTCVSPLRQLAWRCEDVAAPCSWRGERDRILLDIVCPPLQGMDMRGRQRIMISAALDMCGVSVRPPAL